MSKELTRDCPVGLEQVVRDTAPGGFGTPQIPIAPLFETLIDKARNGHDRPTGRFSGTIDR